MLFQTTSLKAKELMLDFEKVISAFHQNHQISFTSSKIKFPFLCLSVYGIRDWQRYEVDCMLREAATADG